MGFPSIRRDYRAGVFSVALTLGSAGAWADTIVLKNGHRISASNVTEMGDKIRYETNGGELSLPKSIVDHIERGSYVSILQIAAFGAGKTMFSPEGNVDNDACGLDGGGRSLARTCLRDCE